MNPPLVSILTPSFNHARFLGDCLTSVASQTYRPIEQIVCDGGSTDKTLELLRAAPDHVRWVSEPDRGQSDAINKAFAMSQGEIIGWVNSDDAYFCADAVERAVSAFAQSPEVGVVYGDAALITTDNLILRQFTSSPVAFPRYVPFSQPCAFVRRSAIREGESFLREDLQMAMDVDLWLRLSARGVRFRKIDAVLAVDRTHGHRKSEIFSDVRSRENNELSREYGVTFERSLAARMGAALQRWNGLPDVLGWERRYRSAFPLHADATWKRVARQLLVPNSLQGRWFA